MTSQVYTSAQKIHDPWERQQVHSRKTDDTIIIMIQPSTEYMHSYANRHFDPQISIFQK